MNNKLSVSLIAVTLSCAFAFVAYAASTESEEDTVGMELSENDAKAIQEDCHEIGVANDVQGEELNIFVAECFAANTMVIDDANLEDQGIPNQEDESMTDDEEPVEGEEPSTESTN